MAQHDQVIGNADGATFRADLNDALAALFSGSSGPSAPAVTVAYQVWNDTTNGLRKQRNAANTAWIVRGALSDQMTVARAVNTALGVADFGKTFIATGTFTQTLTAAATLGDGWFAHYRNDGTGTITIDPNGSEQIDGATTLKLFPGESCVLRCTGTAFKTIGLQRLTPAYRGGLHGKCRLTKSGADLLLSRYDGLTIVDGSSNILTIPSDGVTLAATSLSAGATYYIYAQDVDGDGEVDTLVPSLTGYTTASNGVKHMTGNTGRVLVGLARTIAGPAWQDSAAQRFVASYFNPRIQRAERTLSAAAVTSSTSFADLTPGGSFVEFVAFAQTCIADVKAVAACSANNARMQAGVGVDGDVIAASQIATTSPASGGSVPDSLGFSQAAVSIIDGYHVAELFGATSSGTATFSAIYTGAGVMFQG